MKKEYDEEPLTGQLEDEMPPSDEGQGEKTEEESLSPFEELRRKKGFKTADDLADSYVQAERLISDLGEKNAKMLERLERLENLVKQGIVSPRSYMPEENPQKEAPTEEDEFFVPTPQKVKEVAKKAVKEVVEEYQKQLMMQRLTRVRMSDPETFDRLRPVMIQISQENPHLDIEEIFDEAKKREKDYIEKIKQNVMGGMSEEELKKVLRAIKKADQRTGFITGGGSEAKEPSPEEKDIYDEIFGEYPGKK